MHNLNIDLLPVAYTEIEGGTIIPLENIDAFKVFSDIRAYRVGLKDAIFNIVEIDGQKFTNKVIDVDGKVVHSMLFFVIHPITGKVQIPNLVRWDTVNLRYDLLDVYWSNQLSEAIKSRSTENTLSVWPEDSAEFNHPQQGIIPKGDSNE